MYLSLLSISHFHFPFGSFYFTIVMEKLYIQDLSAPRAESFEPPPSEYPIHTSTYSSALL
jgi:hypothetical protein